MKRRSWMNWILYLQHIQPNARRESIRDRYHKAGVHAILRDLRAMPALVDYLNARLGEDERPERAAEFFG